MDKLHVSVFWVFPGFVDFLDYVTKIVLAIFQVPSSQCALSTAVYIGADIEQWALLVTIKMSNTFLSWNSTCTRENSHGREKKRIKTYFYADNKVISEQRIGR